MTPDNAIQKALSFHEAMELDKALDLYRLVIDQDPRHFQALNLMGLAYQQLDRHQEAFTVFVRALCTDQSHALTHFSAGASALRLGLYQNAIHHFNDSLALEPHAPQALINKGIALHKLGEFELARKSYSLALSIDPLQATAHFNLGCTLQEMAFSSALDLAIQSYETAIAINPQDPVVYNNLGNTLKAVKSYDLAIRVFKSALTLNPDVAASYYNKGTTEFFAKNYAVAVEDLNQALRLEPESVASWNNLGNALKELACYESAIKAYERVLDLNLNKHSVEIYYNIGIVQHELGDYTTACENYSKALQIDPSYTLALSARAITYRHLKRFDEAIKDFKRVLVINPHFEYVVGNLLHTQMHIADWSCFEKYVESSDGSDQWLKAQILTNQKVSHPFPVLALYDDPALNHRASQIWFLDKHSTLSEFNPRQEMDPEHRSSANIDNAVVFQMNASTEDPKKRIRIAYLSADFHNHATAYLIAELFELHNKDDFEIYALSFGPKTNDVMQNRIRLGVENFLEVGHLSDTEIAMTCKSLQIDIAVDLKGYTLQSRFNIFLHRCAPIQVSYIGYPGTSGSTCIDYLIADYVCVPDGDEVYYSEKIVRMPNSYQVNDAQRAIKPCLQTREEIGLPKEGFVFCCFNSVYKITPQTFDVWMTILDQVEHSVLWLLEDSEVITENLKASALARSIHPSRLVFAKRTSLGEHLGRHVHAGLFLDTLPYNAHTTASDALWAGLPVLTLKGRSFAARVASSLLNALGLDDLITESRKSYVEKAVHLAKNPTELVQIKARLAANKTTSALFDTQQFTNQLESAYKSMKARSAKGEKPDHIVVEKRGT